MIGGLLVVFLGSPPAQAATTAAVHRRVDATLSPAPDASGTVWLCQPGSPDDPCAAPLTTTVVSANGKRTVEDLNDAANPVADCFFVYPTVSTEKTDNSNLVVKPQEVAAAVAEASPFSQVCRVWAPMYRQETATDLAGPGGVIHNDVAAEDVAYASVLSAWKDYLANDNDGRPIIFLGHSQGAAMLIRLLRSQIDPNPRLRAQMVSAIILGGNVEVPDGKLSGATFRHIPACTSSTEIGCVIAYSSFDHTPPVKSLFGRPGQGVSLQSNQSETRGVHVLCTNPAALGGGSAPLQDRFFADGGSVLGEPITTPWVAYPDLYQGECRSSGGATWLQITSKPSDPRPHVTDNLGPLWGLHDDDVNLAVGNLVHDVATEESAFAR